MEDTFYVVLTGYRDTVSALTVKLDKPLELQGDWEVSISDFSYSGTKSKLDFVDDYCDALRDPTKSFIGICRYGGINITKDDQGNVKYHPQIASQARRFPGRHLKCFDSSDRVFPVMCPPGFYRTKEHLVKTIQKCIPPSLKDDFAISIDVQDNLKEVTFEFFQKPAEARAAPGRFNGHQMIFIGPVVSFLGLEDNIYREADGRGAILEHFRDLDAISAITDSKWFNEGTDYGDVLSFDRLNGIPSIYLFPPVSRYITDPASALAHNRTLANYKRVRLPEESTDGATETLSYKFVHFASHKNVGNNGLNKQAFKGVLMPWFYPDGDTVTTHVYLPNAPDKDSFLSGYNTESFSWSNMFKFLDRSFFIKTVGKEYLLYAPHFKRAEIGDPILNGAGNPMGNKTIGVANRFCRLMHASSNVPVSIVNKHSIINPTKTTGDTHSYYTVNSNSNKRIKLGQFLNIPKDVSHADAAFLYCDLIHPSYLENKRVNLLDIFIVNQETSESVSLNSAYSKRAHRLQNTRFQSIRVDIRDKNDQPFEFFPESEVYLTLEFKKASNVSTQGI